MTVFENNQKNYCQKADVKRTFFLRDFLRFVLLYFQIIEEDFKYEATTYDIYEMKCEVLV